MDSYSQHPDSTSSKRSIVPVGPYSGDMGATIQFLSVILLVLLLLARTTRRKLTSDAAAHRWVLMHYHKSGHDLTRIVRSVFADQNCVPHVEAHSVPRRVDVHEHLQLVAKEQIAVVVSDALFDWTDFGPAKIVHFVREPADMIISGYLYHAQTPVPPDEGWLKNFGLNICDEEKRNPTYISLIQEFVGSAEAMNAEKAVQRVRDLCGRLKRKYQRASIHDMMKSEDQNYADMYAGIRVEAVRAILTTRNGDLMRMASNCIWESRAPPGTSFRVFMSDIPVGERRVVNGTVSALMSYLMPDNPPGVGDSGGKAFWEGCITRDVAEAKCAERMYVDPAHVAHSTSKGAVATHVTQGFISGHLREHYKHKLLTDPDLGPLLRILNYVMLETTTPALAHISKA
jgi:hypothetical protein